ncbi:hypothetical protein QAD02_004625 [Eretmocerus hayati]|uniref:Uncharacterized protein n=1 Tax=Eretmocerus hayati TaxID=131215 RepID=A0ACC2NR90_9HYME|nr:hypothetical protein QAD02_004625 [Eretmocerus hayati]
MCLGILLVVVDAVSSELLLPKKWEVTELKHDKLSYEWTLDPVSFLKVSEVCIKSHEFSSTENSNQIWRLILCSSTQVTKLDNIPGLFNVTQISEIFRIGLFYLSGNSKDIGATYTITFMNKTFDQIYQFSGIVASKERENKSPKLIKYDPFPGYYGQNGTMYQEFVIEKSQLNMQDTDEFIINLDMSLTYRSTRNFVSKECSVTSPTFLANLRSGYQKQHLEYKKYENLVLGTRNGLNIITSESLLSECSFVWSHRQLSEQKDEINFKEFDYEVVNETLHFLYHGEAPKMKKLNKQLFIVAKKFMLNDLWKLAEEDICNNLSHNMNDIIKNLIFAAEKGAISVKSRIVNYLASQPAQILETPRFSQLQKSHPNLIEDILNAKKELATE